MRSHFIVSRRALLSTVAIGATGALASISFPAKAHDSRNPLSFRENRELHRLLVEGDPNARHWSEGDLYETLNNINIELTGEGRNDGILRDFISLLYNDDLNNSNELRQRIDATIAEVDEEEGRGECGIAGDFEVIIASGIAGTIDARAQQYAADPQAERYLEESRPWYVGIIQSAVAGALIGSRFGWQGAVGGALVGALLI